MLDQTKSIIRNALALDPMSEARKQKIMRAIRAVETGKDQQRQRVSGRQARLILGVSRATWWRRREDADSPYSRLTTIKDGATEFFYLDEIEALRDGAK